MSGWDFTGTYFFWGDGTYSTRRELVECHRVCLAAPLTMFGPPRHPIAELP